MHSEIRIRHIIISLIDSGLSLFYESFSEDPVDPDLFSALFTAITLSNRAESKTDSKSTHDIYDLEDYVIHICYGEQLAGIAIADGIVDNKTMEQLTQFVKVYESEYGLILTNWDGDFSFFDHEWASSQLSEFITFKGITYRLHDNALQRAKNGRHIRIIHLLRRSASTDLYSIEDICKLLVDSFEIQSATALEYVSDLEQHGMIVPLSQ